MILRFKEFITEGGNIKVGPKGQEVSAAPFKVTDKSRSERASDIHGALTDLHNSFSKEHPGEHLFGNQAQGLRSGSIYAGSTKQLMDRKIPSAEFAQHKPEVGDVDVQIPKEHGEKLHAHLAPGKKFGKYTVVGTKKHGNEISAVMKHDNGEHHQFDFEKTHFEHGEPTKGEQFLHSSNWEDTKAGIKGAHHKILLNAIASATPTTSGSSTHKFSISHGLRPRDDDSAPGLTHPEHISKTLFSPNADHSKIHSFQGVAELIKKHVPKERHQEVFDKFKEGVSRLPYSSDKAIAHLKTHLGVKDTVKEEAEPTHHVHMSYIGSAPTHMGHHIDVGGSMDAAPAGKRFIGLSGKSDVFSNKEREDIASKQANNNTNFEVVKSPGITIAKAYNALPKTGKKVLHLHFGSDRKSFAEGLKKSVMNDKIPELGGNKFDDVHIHYPKDENRSHGFSGTGLRSAVASGDTKTAEAHLGPNLNKKEKTGIINKMSNALQTGKMAVKR
jgi:hypothetical protein